MFIIIGVIVEEVGDVIMMAHDKVPCRLVVMKAIFDLVSEHFTVFWASFKEDPINCHNEGGFSWLVWQGEES